jgi:hypothetical protein
LEEHIVVEKGIAKIKIEDGEAVRESWIAN